MQISQFSKGTLWCREVSAVAVAFNVDIHKFAKATNDAFMIKMDKCDKLAKKSAQHTKNGIKGGSCRLRRCKHLFVQQLTVLQWKLEADVVQEVSQRIPLDWDLVQLQGSRQLPRPYCAPSYHLQEHLLIRLYAKI